MDVGYDCALADFDCRGAPERLVLADLGDVVGQLFLDRAAWVLSGAERLDVGAVLERELGDVADELLKGLVLGDEIGLGIDLDDGTARALDGGADQTLGSRAAGFLGGSRKALGAQPVDGCLHLAIGLGKRFLAVHHAGAGALAQFLDGRGRDLSHFRFLLSSPAKGRSPANKRKVWTPAFAEREQSA